MADGSHFIITLVFLIKLTDMLSEITYGVRDKVSYRYGVSKIAQVLLFIALLIAGKLLTVADEIIFMAIPLTILLVFFVYDYPSLSLKSERAQFQFTAVLSIIYSVGVALFGGFAQFFATQAIALTGSLTAPAWYLIGGTLLSLTVMGRLKEPQATLPN